ncbi:hypothetical protein [Pseudomonas helleri]
MLFDACWPASPARVGQIALRHDFTARVLIDRTIAVAMDRK